MVVLAACSPPDRPASLTRSTPGAAMALLSPDTVRRADLYPGVTYRYLWSPKGPWAVHLVDVESTARCEIGFDVLQAERRESGGLGRERVSGMVRRAGPHVLAAVNADFFTAAGSTVGAEVVDGKVTSSAARPAFAWRRGSPPWMGTAAVEGGALRFGWDVPAEGAVDSAGTEAVGGFPDLIDAGRRVGDLEVQARPGFAAARHPRTAVGYDADHDRLWLVVVDGRQPDHSMGMTLPELAELFEALGAEEAINLDGGGSTALVVGPAPVNRPSDAAGERAVVNALALVRTPQACVSDPR